MFFRVENLGPIREAEVDLAKDLIVLTGPNNTGKTYLAWAVYALEKFEFREPLDGVQPLVDAILERPNEQHSFAHLLESDACLRSLADGCAGALDDEFGAPRGRFAETKISLRPGKRPSASGLRRRARGYLGPGRLLYLTVTSPSSLKIGGVERDEAASESTGALEDRDMVRRWLALIASNVIRERRSSWSATVVFPVERLAINTFSKELAGKRTQWADELRFLAEGGDGESMISAVRRRVDLYPRAIRDALYVATQLDALSRRESNFSDLADELEASVLGGAISVGDDDVLEFHPEASPDTKLRIQQTASVVKSLASLVFYLRYQARENHRLIIDEPELNLHPDNQRKVARVLAKLVRRGIRLIISTHSDYLIRELNNLIMLSQDSDAARELAATMSIDPEMTLRPEQLGVYLFGRDGQCKELEVSDTGFEVETIDQEIHSLNQDAQRIYSRLFLEDE